MTFATERDMHSLRAGFQDGSQERRLTEAAMMVAMAEWLFEKGASQVTIHPDGMHLKGFDLPAAWLEREQFVRTSTTGRTNVGGAYRRGSQLLTVYPRSGQGDVVGEIDGDVVEIETKGGCIGTRHPGRRSRLRQGLCEAVGQLMASPRSGSRMIAAAPRHSETEALANRMVERCKAAGIEIALVDGDGGVALIGEHR